MIENSYTNYATLVFLPKPENKNRPSSSSSGSNSSRKNRKFDKSNCEKLSFAIWHSPNDEFLGTQSRMKSIVKIWQPSNWGCICFGPSMMPYVGNMSTMLIWTKIPINFVWNCHTGSISIPCCPTSFYLRYARTMKSFFPFPACKSVYYENCV